MKTRKVMAAGCVLSSLLFVHGCAGGGGGPNIVDLLIARYSAFMSAVNAEDLDATMACYSSSYYNDCSDWQETRDGWQALFAEPNYTLTLSDLVVTSASANGQLGTGRLIGTVKVTEDDNGQVTEETWSIDVWYIREGSSWLFYGDQQCSGSQAASVRAMLASAIGAKRRVSR